MQIYRHSGVKRYYLCAKLKPRPQQLSLNFDEGGQLESLDGIIEFRKKLLCTVSEYQSSDHQYFAQGTMPHWI